MNYGYGSGGYGYTPMAPLSGGLGQTPGVPRFQGANTSVAADEQRLQILKAMGVDEGMLHDFFKGRQAFNTWKGDLRGALGDTVLGNGTGGFDAANTKLANAFTGGRYTGGAVDAEAGVKAGQKLKDLGAAEGADAGTGEGGVPTSAKAAALKSL